MQAHLSSSQIAQLHRQLLNKGAEVNEQLVRLLSGERVNLDGVLAARPGERPVERLRRFLDLIDSKIQASQHDSRSRFGFCGLCDAPLPFAELQQVPWAERCRTCAERA